MRYKVGDVVEVVGDEEYYSRRGDIVKVIEVKDYLAFPYKCKILFDHLLNEIISDDRIHFRDSELKKLPEKIALAYLI